MPSHVLILNVYRVSLWHIESRVSPEQRVWCWNTLRLEISCSGQFYSNLLSVSPPTTIHVKPLHPHKVSMFECQNLVVEGEVSQWHQKYQFMSEYEFIPGHSCWISEVIVGSVLHRWVVSWKQYISWQNLDELLFAWILFVEFKDRLLYFKSRRKC